MQKKCKQCGKEFEAVRDTATYCSDKCRKQSQRLAGQEISGTNLSGTDNKKIEKYPEGHCQGCGEKQSHPLIKICHKCIAKGLTRKKLNLPEVKRIQISDKPVTKWNWQKHGIAEKKKIAYILYYLKENIKFNAIFNIGGKLFELNKPKQSAVNIPPQFNA